MNSWRRARLKIFRLKNSYETISLMPSDISAKIKYRDGRTQKREINYGESFMSQSARFLHIESNISSVEIKNNKGEIRTVDFFD